MNHFDTTTLKSCGDDVLISPHAVFRRPELVEIGAHVAIDEYVVVTTGLSLGDYIHIAPHVTVIGGKTALLQMGHFTNIATKGTVVCGSDRFMGAGLITAPHIPDEYRDELVIEPVIFEDFANVGAAVTILPGVTLPQGVVIGAGSLVRKSDVLKPWTVYAGNPLRELKLRPHERMLAAATALGHTITHRSH